MSSKVIKPPGVSHLVCCLSAPEHLLSRQETAPQCGVECSAHRRALTGPREDASTKGGPVSLLKEPAMCPAALEGFSFVYICV